MEKENCTIVSPKRKKKETKGQWGENIRESQKKSEK